MTNDQYTGTFMRKIIFIILFGIVTMGGQAQSLLETFLSPAQLPVLKPSRLYQISSYDTTGGNDDRINLKPGEKATIANIQGPGIITRIWLTIDSRDPYFLRRIVLRMYWDDEQAPSVEVPVGDFFGTGFEYRHYISRFLGMSSGGYYCYFPMPFNRSARLEVENQTGQEVYAFYYQIDYQKLETPLPENVAYFHAQWRREIRTKFPRNYTVLEATGRGQFVGMNLNMQSYRRSLWYLEGDEMVYVDGERSPSIQGTGTEDYFNSGWYFNKGEFYAPLHGVIIKDDSLARIAAYRFQVGDAIPFKKSLRFTIEHGHANGEEADYSSTAYWYQKEPHQPFPPLLKASLRIPLRVAVPPGAREFETLQPSGKGIRFGIEDMSDFGPDWSNFKQLKVTVNQSGGKFSIVIPNLEERAYHVHLYYTRGPEYGIVQVFIGGKSVGEIPGYNKTVIPGGEIVLSNVPVKDGKVQLTFVVESPAENAGALSAGLDAYVLEPVRDFIPEWYIIGPFPNPRKSEKERLGLDVVYPPEKEIDYSRSYSGVDGQQVVWQKIQTPKDGRVHLWNLFSPYELVVAYAVTYVYSPVNQTVPLLIGSDDGIKVFVNGKPVFQKLLVRISMPDQDRIPVKLHRGWNQLLLKIENNFGGYAFFARFLDPRQELRYSTQLKKKEKRLKIKEKIEHR